MLKLPCCDVCTNRIGKMEDNACKAYPNGIPKEIMYCIEEKELTDCGDGYSFKVTDSVSSKGPDSNGLCGKLLDMIGS